MSVTDAFNQAQAGHAERAAHARALGHCYRAVFYGTPQASDQEAVRHDLEAFCGMRTSLMRTTFEDTAAAVGQFRVWQRIIAFCFPRDEPGGTHGQENHHDHRPIAGGGVTERTID